MAWEKGKIIYGFGIMYIIASIIIFYFAISNVSLYKEWANTALIPFYTDFMINISIPLLRFIIILVSVYQVIMGICFLFGEGKYLIMGIIFSIVFHIIIIPWGYWSLPNLLFVIIMLFILNRKIKKRKTSKINL
jgi:hypothetical protein